MEIDRFDRPTIDKYLVMAKKQYPDIDIHFLEYAIADYLIYDVEKNERPTEDNEDFIRANKVIEELKEQKRILDKELCGI
jgi:hypothetical protein